MDSSFDQSNPNRQSGLAGLAKRGGAGVKLGFLVGVVLGSGLMYIFYPGTFNRKRALARDKAFSLFRSSATSATKTLRHLRNQLQGALANAAHAISPNVVVSDRRLFDRIRSTIGRTIDHPHAVDYAVHDGRVTVRGSLRQNEAGLVIRAIEAIPGVRAVDNQILEGGEPPPPVQ